jgi:hypothetical protein
MQSPPNYNKPNYSLLTRFNPIYFILLLIFTFQGCTNKHHEKFLEPFNEWLKYNHDGYEINYSPGKFTVIDTFYRSDSIALLKTKFQWEYELATGKIREKLGEINSTNINSEKLKYYTDLNGGFFGEPINFEGRDYKSRLDHFLSAFKAVELKDVQHLIDTLKNGIEVIDKYDFFTLKKLALILNIEDYYLDKDYDSEIFISQINKARLTKDDITFLEKKENILLWYIVQLDYKIEAKDIELSFRRNINFDSENRILKVSENLFKSDYPYPK